MVFTKNVTLSNGNATNVSSFRKLEMRVKFCFNDKDYCIQVYWSLHLRKLNSKEISAKPIWKRWSWTVDLPSLYPTEAVD